MVSRSYIKNSGGADDVYTLITIGTPHHGVDGKESAYVVGVGGLLSTLCQTGIPLFKEGHSGEECGEMWHESDFVINLNSNDETYGNVEYYSIIGNCCEGTDGTSDDEVVSVDSATLDGAENIILTGNKVDWIDTFHQNLIHPSKVPKVYSKVKEILESFP